jgi:hypothetical protein
VRLSDLYPERYLGADGYVTSQPLDAAEPAKLGHALTLAGPNCAAIITNTPHNTAEACAIVRNLVALVEEQQVDFVAALFRSIWGAEPGRLPYLNRPSFFGEILCCWRPRWIPGTKKSPMHAYAWYVWRKEPRSGPSLKVRVGKSETITALSAVNLPMRLTISSSWFETSFIHSMSRRGAGRGQVQDAGLWARSRTHGLARSA